jgi:hypothetical protein
MKKSASADIRVPREKCKNKKIKKLELPFKNLKQHSREWINANN